MSAKDHPDKHGVSVDPFRDSERFKVSAPQDDEGSAGGVWVGPAQASQTGSSERFKVSIRSSEDDRTARTQSQGFLETRAGFGSTPNIFTALYSEEDGSTKEKSVQKLLETYTAAGEDEDEDGPREKANLGTTLGVFFPCIQNIFGVIYFVRLYWIVGEAGIWEAFTIVFSCCCVSILTSLSISAIATNGKVHGGGTYFMISRSLGPEFGGAVGILFYLGISVSVAMYLIGSIELLLKYIAPQMNVFENHLNNFRLWGSVLLFLVACAVFTGVKFVSRFALLVLSAVLVSILSVYIGMFSASADNSAKACFLGNRLLSSDVVNVEGKMMCTKDPSGPIFRHWCTQRGNHSECDPYFENNEAELKAAVPGLKGGVFEDNSHNHYGMEGQVSGTREDGDEARGEILRDIDTSFVVLLAIYFPSITGFEQGTSYSGDLEDAQKSIPLGTLLAVAVTSTVYLSTVVMFGATVHGAVLRDKYGVSIGGKLIMSQLSWPSPWVILIGALMSTVGAGLQALTAAPRLLQAVAKDDVLGAMIRPFAYMTQRNEPLPAIALSTAIAEVGILIARLDYVAPIVTMFFLLCYGFVNLACALQSFLDSPHWRPRFKFYHWTLAFLGVILCLTLMFLSSVPYALIALGLAGSVYKYIEYKGAEKEWGDGMRGLSLAAAQVALLRLREDMSEKGTKNWRPQLLVLAKLNSDLQIPNDNILAFCSQLKEGKGLTIVSSVITGDYFQEKEKVNEAKMNIRECMERNSMEGFTTVVMADKVSQGICHVIQSAGLGGLYPNTVIIAWPTHWFNSQNRKSYETFIDSLHCASAAKKAVLVLKSAEDFPTNSARLSGTIDIWWIMHDGSLLIMLAFLLIQHKVWKQCRLRIFTVAQMKDNSVQIKKDLIDYIYNLRISASVEVVEMEDRHISAYTIERTLMMEERTKLMEQMRLKQSESVKIVDNIMDRAHNPQSSQRLSVVSVESAPRRQRPSLGPTEAPKVGLDTSMRLVVDTDKKDASSDTVQYTFTPEGHDPRVDVRKAFNASNNSARAPAVVFNTPSPEATESGSSHSRAHPDGASAAANPGTSAGTSNPGTSSQMKGTNMRKMHTAVRLNQVLRERSSNADLVILNLPSVPSKQTSQASYMQFLEVLSEGLNHLVMVRGTGREVITIYN